MSYEARDGHDVEPEEPADDETPERSEEDFDGDRSAEEAGGVGDVGGSEGLSEEIQRELEELEELRDRHLRLAAEFENFRKRTRRELAEARERGQAELAGRLLEALDDLERLQETPDEQMDPESFAEAVEMVHRKLWKELQESGLTRMDPEGERFDPEVHDALLTAPADSPEESDVVSRVLINGYSFGDRVLRPARVEVKKYRPPEDDPGADSGDED